jgi:ATP-dependent DNA helicase RecQ
MPDDILATLELAPADVPALSAKARNALITYLLRWGHPDAARRCLQQLLATHSHLVSVYDNLVDAYLALDRPDLALEIVDRRHALRLSNSSRILEAKALLAAGNLAAARAIAHELTVGQPYMVTAWDLQAQVCLAARDFDGAEAAWRQRDTLAPESPTVALGLARLFQARGDAGKALLWARTALSRSERDERQPSIELLHLLETLYRVTDQQAQAEATAAELRRRQQADLDNLRRLLGLVLPTPRPREPQSSAPRAMPHLAPDEQTRLDVALRRHFGHDAFRPGQAEVIAAVLRGESVLAVMPTGFGKSLCYQLAALLLPRTTLVISPLIALMKDQIDGLPPEVAARATTLNSTLDGNELEARLDRAAAGSYKLLYAAPERLRQRPFLHALKQAGVSLLVVDEAHCVSLWGHDFRPDYRFIAKAWHELGRPPILGMTATATPRVCDDVQAALSQMYHAAIDVHRPNLRLEARQFANDGEKRRALLALCRQIEGSGIVYANSRRKCEELAAMLDANGVSAMYYHAGIDDRAAAQDRFMRDQVRVVVATVAFGMGVDKADVRFIVHYHPPRALENYFQEAGRAGRDGRPARCILFHAPSDKANLTRWTRQDALHLEFLRRVYAAIQARIGTAGIGLVTVGDLERDLVADPTHLRVSIHFLETAGLVWRGFDLPRTATLALSRSTDGAGPEWTRFVEAARLVPGQTVSRNLLALSHDAGLDPRTIEAQLLAWQDSGWLTYRGIGRDMLLALPEPPSDSRERVAAMLADYRAGQDGRIAEIMAYAATRRCRHGYISAYFGGRPIDHCQSCDNCQPAALARYSSDGQLAPSPGSGGASQPDRAQRERRPQEGPGEPLEARLLAWRRETARKADVAAYVVLPNSTVAEIVARRPASLGALRTIKGIGPKRLERYGLSLLELLGSATAAPPAAPIPPEPAKAPRRAEVPTDYDETLFQRLRAWRLGVAHKIAKPPYIVFHDAVLKRIAAAQPATRDQLAAIKGVGPLKLERYGNDVLSIVARHDVVADSEEP